MAMADADSPMRPTEKWDTPNPQKPPLLQLLPLPPQLQLRTNAVAAAAVAAVVEKEVEADDYDDYATLMIGVLHLQMPVYRPRNCLQPPPPRLLVWW